MRDSRICAHQLTTADGQLSTDTLPSSDYPPAASLRTKLENYPLPVVAPGTVDPAALTGDILTKHALDVLATFNSALAANDSEALQNCFFAGQAYWKDALALTWHLRTFTSPDVASAHLHFP